MLKLPQSLHVLPHPQPAPSPEKSSGSGFFFALTPNFNFYLYTFFLCRRKKGWKKRRCHLPGVNPILKSLTEEEKEKSDDACEYLRFTRNDLRT